MRGSVVTGVAHNQFHLRPLPPVPVSIPFVAGSGDAHSASAPHSGTASHHCSAPEHHDRRGNVLGGGGGPPHSKRFLIFYFHLIAVQIIAPARGCGWRGTEKARGKEIWLPFERQIDSSGILFNFQPRASLRILPRTLPPPPKLSFFVSLSNPAPLSAPVYLYLFPSVRFSHFPTTDRRTLLSAFPAVDAAASLCTLAGASISLPCCSLYTLSDIHSQHSGMCP